MFDLAKFTSRENLLIPKAISITQPNELIGQDGLHKFAHASSIDVVLSKTAGRIYIDVPEAQAAFTQVLAAAGFTRQRGLVRMAKSPSFPLPPPDSIYAIGGPELG